MKPPHKHFFSSLKHLQKRLKLDDGDPPSPPPPPSHTETQPSQSSTSSPIYFHNHTNTSSTFHHNSIEQPPHEFLSINNSQSNPNQSDNLSQTDLFRNNTVGEINTMIELLSLSEFDGKVTEMGDVGDDEFYDKIVKVKGPKCKKEVERLDNWIKYLMNNNNNGIDGFEPLRLGHLLLAKAAVVSDDGYGVEFPVTVDEFLHHDPPL
ncbi:hypothetical protein QVD17_33186 [Tagetes erecta]|uniref:Uncharacterized protein n=1 Tax=Tagetes erecta TaxID=13708 RepID=A0AAD8JY65_TARER|nr:hypothetical protein QVD17_33186 [Tagetes erecta]